jgi:copper chaperone
MARRVLNVPDVSCEHCERTIENALQRLGGIRSVAVDIPAHEVTVDYDESRLNVDRIKDALSDEEYPVAAVRQGPG